MGKKQAESNTPPSIEPIILSFSMVQRNEGWSVATIKTQGDKVISTEYSEPDMKPIAMHDFKIACARLLFMSHD